MKHLTTYNKLFESTIYSEEMEAAIEDILIDIKDEQFRVDISVLEYTFNHVAIHVYITPSQYPDKHFRFLDVKESILHLVSHLREEGFDFKAHYVFHHRPKEFDFIGASDRLDLIVMNRLELRFNGSKR
jgi:hypothetical protein